MASTKLLLIWGAMLLLLAASITATLIPALGAWRQLISLGIAGIKSGLILWFFMELRQASGLMRLVLLAPLLFVAILETLLVIDYASRGWLGN